MADVMSGMRMEVLSRDGNFRRWLDRIEATTTSTAEISSRRSTAMMSARRWHSAMPFLPVRAQ